jgi:hypothetical protein
MPQFTSDSGAAIVARQLAADIAHQEVLERRAGGNLSAHAVGRLLGISPRAVEKRRRAKALLATRQGEKWTYPRAQFHRNEAIPCLEDVVRGFDKSGPWVTLEFLVTEEAALDGLTPRDALLTGDDMRKRVLALVRGHYEGEGFA